MERVRRLNRIWTWLPAFRAVAETEHLPTAAQALHVTPSALSRSIRLLQEELGVSLFDRTGRRIVLNEAGKELLRSTRDAMRRLDDAVLAAREEGLLGAFRIAAPSPYLPIFVLPALRPLQEEHPLFLPYLSSADAQTCNTALLKGELDLALLDDPIHHDRLKISKLVDIAHGAYCGRGHPLFDVPAPTLEEITHHPFAAPPDHSDHWPPHLGRSVAMYLSHMQLGIEVCAQGRYLAVLPDVVAAAVPQRECLRRLPLDVFAPAALYAVHRLSLTERCPTKLVLNAIEDLSASV